MDLPKLYGRRKGRPLHKHKAALVEEILPRLQFEVEAEKPLDLAALFPRAVDGYELEIGFGGGDHLAGQAEVNKNHGYIGCEPFLNGVANLLQLVVQKQLDNVRVYPDDARRVLNAVPDGALSRCFLLFPDPWPKARHTERRFICKDNLDRLARALRSGGELRLATDMPFLAEWMEEYTEAHGAFRAFYTGREAPSDWISTKYEQKGLAAGRQPFYMCYRRV